MANIPLKSIKFPDLADTYTVPSNAGELPYNKSATYPDDTVGKALQNIGDSSAPAIIETAQGSIASFDDGADNVPVKDLVAEIVPLQSGSGDPSPSNVRAISGWSECNVTVDGKNFLNLADISGWKFGYDDIFTITGQTVVVNVANNYSASQIIDFISLPKGTYTISISNPARLQVIWDGTVKADVSNVTSCTFTLTENRDDVSFKILASSYPFTAGNLQLELGSTATTYEPYSGEVHTISFASAGTVYGGRLDVTSGVLTVDRAMVDLGELNWILNSGTNRANSTDLDGSIVVPPSSQPADAIAEKYKMLAASGTLTLGTMAVLSSGGLDTLIAYYDGVNRPSGKFVYLLQTPHTYQLTPTEVKSLLKNNNIWADTGDVTVEYVADTKTFIENLVNA